MEPMHCLIRCFLLSTILKSCASFSTFHKDIPLGGDISKLGYQRAMEIDLITEVKYFQKEGMNPLAEVDPEWRGWTSKRWRRISCRMWEWTIWWPLVRTPLWTHDTHHGIQPPYPLFLNSFSKEITTWPDLLRWNLFGCTCSNYIS